MSLNVGDSIFSANGRPGVITKKNEATGELSVQHEGKAIDEQKTLGYVNGVDKENRKTFNTILKDIRKENDPAKRVAMLLGKINELKNDPKNLNLVKYLQSEMVHTMNSENIRPKEYNVYEDSVRT